MRMYKMINIQCVQISFLIMSKDSKILFDGSLSFYIFTSSKIKNLSQKEKNAVLYKSQKGLVPRWLDFIFL